MNFFRRFWFQHFLGQRFQWYRRWFGGRWELHWIDICGSDIWLSMSNDPALDVANVIAANRGIGTIVWKGGQ